jgi:acyl-CoA thioesterase-1
MVPRHDLVASNRMNLTRRATFLLAAAALAACGKRTPRSTPTALPAGATVLALGDSITFGTGTEPAAAYPARLAALTGWNVVNAGVPGDTAAMAAERLPALLDEHKPALVILSAGGNDFLRRLDPAATEAALRRSVAQAREAGAQVLLVGVPQPTLGAGLGFGLGDHPLYARLAQELALPLHAGGWSRVLGDASLRSDQIHANAAGYAAFADGLAATLREHRLLATP